MKSLFLYSFALLLLCCVFTTSSADTKLYRLKRDLPSVKPSLTQEIQRELQSLQNELLTLPRNVTAVVEDATGGDGQSGLSNVFNIILQTILIIPKGILTVAITFFSISNRIIGGVLNGLTIAFENVLNWLNSL